MVRMMMDDETRSLLGVRPEINLRASVQRAQNRAFSSVTQAPFMGRRLLAWTLHVRAGVVVQKSAPVYHPIDHYRSKRISYKSDSKSSKVSAAAFSHKNFLSCS